MLKIVFCRQEGLLDSFLKSSLAQKDDFTLEANQIHVFEVSREDLYRTLTHARCEKNVKNCRKPLRLRLVKG